LGDRKNSNNDGEDISDAPNRLPGPQRNMNKVFAALGSSCLLLAACGGDGGGGSKSAPNVPPPVICDDSFEFCDDIPGTADTCTDPQFWPLSETSALHPVTVHYSRLKDQQEAQKMIGLLDESWSVQVDTLGFTPPIDDQGQCGPDGNFDVFIWRGIDGAYVSGVSANPATPFDDYSTFMAIDIGGSIRKRLLDTYIAHELNHAMQASDDWWEASPYYESGATFAEALVYPDQSDYFFTLEDFQNNPGWSLFYDDSFATWYMYGAAMYLHFLSERHFVNDPAFYARIWRATRSEPRGKRPDYIDALRSVLLVERGVTLDETVLEFTQWRWFVDQFDDGAHFSKGAAWRHPVAFTDIDVATLPVTQTLSAMIYGANYLRLSNSSGSPVDIVATLQQSDPEVNWQMLEVEGGEVIAPLTIPASGSVVIASVVSPVDAVWTDTLSFDEHAVELSLAVVP